MDGEIGETVSVSTANIETMINTDAMTNGVPNVQAEGEEDTEVPEALAPTPAEKLKSIGQLPANGAEEIWPLPPPPQVNVDHSEEDEDRPTSKDSMLSNGHPSQEVELKGGQSSESEWLNGQVIQSGNAHSKEESHSGQPSGKETKGDQPPKKNSKNGQPLKNESKGSSSETHNGQAYQFQSGQPSKKEMQSDHQSKNSTGQRGQSPHDNPFQTHIGQAYQFQISQLSQKDRQDDHQSQTGVLYQPQSDQPSQKVMLQSGQPAEPQTGQQLYAQNSPPYQPQTGQLLHAQSHASQPYPYQSGQPRDHAGYLSPEPYNGYLRRVRSNVDFQRDVDSGQAHFYTDGGQEVMSEAFTFDPPSNKRHSWAPQIAIDGQPETAAGTKNSGQRSRFTVVPVPMAMQRKSYCGAPPSAREFDQYVRSSGGQSPSIYVLTPPDRAPSPFGFADRESVESLSYSMPNSPSLRPLLDGHGRKVSGQNVLQIPTDSGQSMVLQLVLPQSQNSNNSGQGNSIAAPPQLEAITCPPSTENYDNSKAVDTLQTASPTCTVSPSNSMNALVKPDGHNLYPQLTNGDQSTAITVNGDAKNKAPLPPPSTPEEEKKTIFTKNLTTMLSSIYAIFIVMMGGVVYVADVLQPMKAYGEIFTIYLTIVGLAWLVFLHVDIRAFLNTMAIWRNQDKRRTFGRDNEGFDKSYDTVDKSEIKPSSSTSTLPRPPDSYCFKTGRHSGSFYLKIGAAVFCFGHLIHEGLLLSRQIAYFTSDQKYLNQCSDPIALILSILHPLFSFYQLFMVFKYSNIIINRYKEIARFAIMHIIAANLCLWVNTIIRETEEALAHKASHLDNSTGDDDHDDDHDTLSTLATLIPHSSFSDHDEDSCVTKTILSAFTLQAAPYLYPFTIEYSLLQVGIWFIVWYNIGDTESIEAEKHHSRHPSGDDGTGTYEDLATGDSFTSNLVIHVDCHSANRGLFAGLFILLATVVSVIIFFVAMTNAQYIKTGVVINNVSDTVLLLLMIFSVAFAYRQTSNLDFNDHAVTFLDDFLLYIALPCFFLYAIFNVVASIATNNPFTIVISVLCVIQVTIQTPFIVDGLRRCSNSYLLRFKKPGREIITFLIVCNVACWILETFEIKSYEAHSDRIEFYGSFLWTLLSHVTLPLTLFYRFHSSVCLVDMWKSAYEPGDTH